MYTSVVKSDLQKAFALAHRAWEDEKLGHRERQMFRAIAQLIWRAHGEPGVIPEGSGREILDTFRDQRIAREGIAAATIGENY